MRLRYHADRLALRGGAAGSGNPVIPVDERLLEVRRHRPRRKPSTRVLSVLLSAALALSMIPVAAAQAEGTATLKYGMSGSSVKTLQTNLVTRGYLKSADGNSARPRNPP